MDLSEGKFHIFIDTSTLENFGFNLDTDKLQQVLSADEVVSHTTTITLREVSNRMETLLQQARKMARRTRNSEWKDAALFIKAYKQCCAYIHDGDGVNLGTLTKLYLDKRPPFDKKPEEFKDAIAALSLQAWANANEKDVYIISDDKDWDGIRESCGRLHKIKLDHVVAELYKIHQQRELVDTNKVLDAIDNAGELLRDALAGISPSGSVDIIDFSSPSVRMIIHFAQQRGGNVFVKSVFSGSAHISFIDSACGDIIEDDASINGMVEINLSSDYYVLSMTAIRWEVTLTRMDFVRTATAARRLPGDES